MTDAQKRIRLYIGDRTIVVMAAVAAIGLGFAIRRGDSAALGLFVLGWTSYVVEEYLVHRFIFHAPAPQNQFLFDTLYRLHYGHHDQVANKHLLFTPLWFTLAMASLTFGAMLLFLPVRDVAVAVCGGAVCAYLVFEWLHLTSHFKMSSKGRLGRYITRRHAKHHHIDYTAWFTVSPGGQLVDRAFGSDTYKYSVVSNIRTCGLAPHDPRLIRSRARFGVDTSLANRSLNIGARSETAA